MGWRCDVDKCEQERDHQRILNACDFDAARLLIICRAISLAECRALQKRHHGLPDLPKENDQ
jgi:hypothetical protein